MFSWPRRWRRIRGRHDRPARADAALDQGRRTRSRGAKRSDGEAHPSVRTGHPADRSAVSAVGHWHGLQLPRVDAAEPALDEGRVKGAGREVTDVPTAVHVRFRGHETSSELFSGTASPGSGWTGRASRCRPSAPRAGGAGPRRRSRPRCRPGARSRRQRRASRLDVRARLDRPARPVPTLDQRRDPNPSARSSGPFSNCPLQSRRSAADTRRRSAGSRSRRGDWGSARSASPYRPSARPPSSR